jgi:hypothetical protein
MPSLLAVLDQRPKPRPKPPAVLLVIGAHREERDFGDAVAQRLDRARIDLLRIPEGISGRRPGPEGLAAYRRRHDDLYRQILEHVRPAHRLLIDLHTGLDEQLCCADVLCAHTAVLDCIDGGAGRAEGPPLGGPVRGVLLVSGREPPSGPTDDPTATAAPESRQPSTAESSAPSHRWPIVRPEIPAVIWQGTCPLYLGLEVFLHRPGAGTPAEADFAAAVVNAVSPCALAVVEGDGRA